MPKHYELLHVEGHKWDVCEGGIWCMDIRIGTDMLCLWAYADEPDYLCVRYKDNSFVGMDNEQWLGPLETLCLIEEALKGASLIGKNTSSAT
jgi:hypothetical protein